uniref:Transcription factor 24 n=1 Tax=Oryzias sinensis TaxID=183150 RepID=A0A8C7X6D8_9TELE
MLGGQTLRMDSGNCSNAAVDDSPASSPSSSPSPDGRRRELHRARGLQSGGLGGRGRPAAANAARERSRVQTLRTAFLELQRTLPSVPPDTKLSKLDVLILATTYIAHLTRTLQEEGYLHPVKVIPHMPQVYLQKFCGVSPSCLSVHFDWRHLH